LIVPNLSKIIKHSPAPLSATLPLTLDYLEKQDRFADAGPLSARDAEFCNDLHYYAQGPICIMDNLYLGSEHNASDINILKELDIRYVLNVAKEVINPLLERKTPPFPTNDNGVSMTEKMSYNDLMETEETCKKSLFNDGLKGAKLISNSSNTYASIKRTISPDIFTMRSSERKHSNDELSTGLQSLKFPSHDVSHHFNNDFSDEMMKDSSGVRSRSSSPPSLKHHTNRDSGADLSADSEIKSHDLNSISHSNSSSSSSTVLATATTTTTTTISSSCSFTLPSYKKLSWSHAETSLSLLLPAAFQFIDQARLNHHPILIACQQGVSRSASLVIAYVMRAYNMDLSTAYAYVKAKSPCISPNIGFMTALAEFEKELASGIFTG